mgnify:CR=1 FL=1
MKKFRKYFICLLVVFCLFSICVYAEMNLGVEYVNKYDDVYDVDVLVNDNFRLDSEDFEVISLPEDFENITYEIYYKDIPFFDIVDITLKEKSENTVETIEVGESF